MIRKIFTLLTVCFLFTTLAYSQNPHMSQAEADSTEIVEELQDTRIEVIPSQTEKQQFVVPSLDVGLATRNVWRGLNQGETPVFAFDFNTRIADAVIVGTFNTLSLNGRIDGYPNVTEVYFGIEFGDFTFMFDDFFFDSVENDYTDYEDHYPEFQLKYSGNNIDGFVGYDVKSEAFYIQGDYDIDDFTFTLGFLTDKSDLNFMDRGGVTVIGLSYSREIVDNLEVSFGTFVNPNHRYIQESNFLRKKVVNFGFGLNYSVSTKKCCQLAN